MHLEQFVWQHGWLLTYGLIFLWGLAMNLTPCVYPMIPITISYFGGMAGGSTRRSALMALLFVVGIATTYSLLGVSAALTGRLFGATLGNPWVVGVVSVVLVGMALSLLGFFQMAVSSNTLSAISNIRDRLGWVGALFFGLTVGLVMAPCVGPFIISLLTYVATRRDPIQGFWMFFTLAFGMGSPYLILGTFTGTLKTLPRPGGWMVWLEHVFGFVLIGMAINFWVPFMPAVAAHLGVPLYIAMAGFYLGFVDGRSMSASMPKFRTFKQAAGLAVMAAGAWWALSAIAPPPPNSAATIQWKVIAGTGHSLQQMIDVTLQQAKDAHKPVMLDFYATWCAACNELDKKTYNDPGVIQALQPFVRIKVDLSLVNPDDLEADDTVKRFRIRGMPTVIFLDPSGRERDDLRQEGFFTASAMLGLLEKVPKM